MKRKRSEEELQDFFQEGVVGDLMYATRHYFIWRTIGKNYFKLIESNNPNIKNLYGHIQSSSQDLAILSLAKIFDARSNKYQVRSINEFLETDFENTAYFPLYTKDYIEFSVIKSRLGIGEYPTKFESPSHLSSFFKEIFANSTIVDKIRKVKHIRDKNLAHNEHNVEHWSFDNFWNDYLDLIDFIKLFVSLFGITVLGSHYFQFEDFKEGSFHYSIIHQVYWLVEEIEKVIGKENFNYWWTDTPQSDDELMCD